MALELRPLLILRHHWRSLVMSARVVAERGQGGLANVSRSGSRSLRDSAASVALAVLLRSKVLHHYGIDLRIKRFDASDDVVGQLYCGNLSGLQCGNKFFGRAVVPTQKFRLFGVPRGSISRHCRGSVFARDF